MIYNSPDFSVHCKVQGIVVLTHACQEMGGSNWVSFLFSLCLKRSKVIGICPKILLLISQALCKPQKMKVPWWEPHLQWELSPLLLMLPKIPSNSLGVVRILCCVFLSCGPLMQTSPQFWGQQIGKCELNTHKEKGQLDKPVCVTIFNSVS